MNTAKIFCIYPVAFTGIGIFFLGVKFFMYLTNWGLILHLFSFLAFSFDWKRTELMRKLFVTTWAIGWMVCIMFWCYVFPCIEAQKLPPVWHYISVHGAIHGLFVYELLKLGIKANFSDIYLPLSVGFSYIILVVLPLKSSGIIIYPKFFEESIPTIVILIGLVIVLCMSLYPLTRSLIKKSD